MKFEITRSGLYDQPCDDAVRASGIRVDQRTFKTVEAYDTRFKAKWNAVGTNHRITEIGIARDLPCDYWEIEIATLADLVRLLGKYESALIKPEGDAKGLPSIELKPDLG